MLQFIKLIQDIHPNIFIHSVYIEEDLDRDRRAGFYGDVNLQVAQVAEQLSAITQLQNGFDAIGLSQGGQFLRAYVERFNSPPVHNLITFGSQHMGISDIPLCRPRDFICQAARRVAKSAVYSAWAQNNLVQAQYFRDPWNLPAYLIANHFLTSINNEISEMRNRSYSQQLATLNNLVLVLFTEDKTVVPKESAWFGSEIADDGLNWSDQSVLASTTNKTILPLRRQPLYIEDWIGLRKLDERGGIVFESCQGEHMQMSGCWEDLVKKYVGGSR
ncbi:palmitoyl-protein thioesterase [Cyathus striatus]|nr:palmitoyl-protein thioesterase [Cyathus striatus]